MDERFTGVGARVRQARKEKRLTQEGLAKLVGTKQDIISKIERGHIARTTMLKGIADALDQSPAWLMFGCDDVTGLDGAAIKAAINLMKLPKHTREAIQAAIAAASKDQ